MAYNLTVIVPVYNEENTILKLLEKLVESPSLSKRALQIVVVDDGSTDGTAALLDASVYKTDQRFIWLKHEKNAGKGTAIRTGLAKASGQYTIIQDADLEYDPEDIDLLLNHAEEKKLSVVFGSRNLKPENQNGGFPFYWGGKSLSMLTNLLYGQQLTDEPTCYKLVKTDLLKSLPLTCTRFEFCPEVTAFLALKGVKIVELPISYFPRGKKDGKKIGLKDWFDAVWTLFRLRVDTSQKWPLTIACAAFAFFWYLVTWRHGFMGYENETAESAVNMFSGVYQVFRAGPGAVFMYLPFLAVARIFRFENIFGFLTLVPIFYSALTAGVLYLILSRLDVPKQARIPAVLLTTTGSLMWPYSQIGMEYQTMFWLAVLSLALLDWRDTKKSLVFVGAALAMCVFSKSYGVIFILPALGFVFAELTAASRVRSFFSSKNWLSFFGPSILAVAASMGLNWIILGRIAGAYSLAQEFQVWSWWEGFFGIFFSAGKSIFIYSPLLIPALWGWQKFWNRDRAAAIFVYVSFLILLLLTAPFSFWSDETLSVRKLMPVIPLLHLPLAYVLYGRVWGRLKKTGFILLISAALYIQLLSSLYPYWLQLVIYRDYNLDTLTSIRYNPRLSALALNHRLFVSNVKNQISGKSGDMYYSERTWMRCCTGKPEINPFLTRMNVSLKNFDQPDIYLSKAGSYKTRLVLLFVALGGLLVSAGVLAAGQFNHRREEKVKMN